MAEYAPAAIMAVFYGVQAKMSVELSGIIGDRAHTYGYHRGRNYVAPGDYSAVLPEDRQGDGEAAAALDLKFNAADMRVVSERLMAAGRSNDPRLAALREWFGTVDGQRVTGWDRHSPTTPSDDGYTSSDDSHLWHIHLSFYRKYVNDAAALAPIIAVIVGAAGGESAASAGSIELEDTLSAAEIADLKSYIKTATEATTSRVLQDLAGTKARIAAYEAEIVGLRKYLRDTACALGGQISALPDGTKITSIGAAHAVEMTSAASIAAQLTALADRLDKLPAAGGSPDVAAAVAEALAHTAGTITFGDKA